MTSKRTHGVCSKRAAPIVRDMTRLAAAVMMIGSGNKPYLEKIIRYEKATYPNGDVVCVLEIE